jgi:hypothetical protein
MPLRHDAMITLSLPDAAIFISMLTLPPFSAPAAAAATFHF